MPVDIPMGIVMALSVYVAAWFFKKSEFNFGEQGWRWMVTGATFFLVATVLWAVDWNVIGLGDHIGTWFNFALNLFGLLLVVIGTFKVTMSMFSK